MFHKIQYTNRPALKRRAAAAILLLLALLINSPPASGRAQTAITAAHDQAEIQFPDLVTFNVELQSEAEIAQIDLEYRVEQVTCGQVVAKAFPQFTPGKVITASWAWEMKQSGSLPPGARIYWRWRVTDTAGSTLITQEQSTIWLDEAHAWETLTGENINLHWYDSPNTFGQDLLAAAAAALANLEQSTGLKPEKPIDLYIYASTDDLRQAILYEPGWTGGQAFPEYDIVIIGISPGQIDWGKGAIAHELTHVLVGHLTFSCLGYLPGWLVEGLAMYGEGGLDSFSKARFEQAVTDNALISVQALSGGFSENPDKADISYSESYSLVNFLIEAYGKDPMLALLKALKEGATIDGALQAAYGFDINGLEDAWRISIGAQARQAAVEAGTATPTPTLVPTIAPVSAAAAGPTLAPTRVRVTPQAAPPTETPPSRPTAQATATRAILTQSAGLGQTEDSPPKSSSPTWFFGVVRIFTIGGAVCLILAGMAITFFYTVIRPPHRRGKS